MLGCHRRERSALRRHAGYRQEIESRRVTREGQQQGEGRPVGPRQHHVGHGGPAEDRSLSTLRLPQELGDLRALLWTKLTCLCPRNWCSAARSNAETHLFKSSWSVTAGPAWKASGREREQLCSLSRLIHCHRHPSSVANGDPDCSPRAACSVSALPFRSGLCIALDPSLWRGGQRD